MNHNNITLEQLRSHPDETIRRHANGTIRRLGAIAYKEYQQSLEHDMYHCNIIDCSECEKKWDAVMNNNE